MKRGAALKEQAFAVVDPFRVCGIVFDGIEWRNQSFATYCEWAGPGGGSGLLNVTTQSNVCQAKCLATSSCTHYAWSANTCQLRSGTVDKTRVVRNKNPNSVCGFVQTSICAEHIHFITQIDD